MVCICAKRLLLWAFSDTALRVGYTSPGLVLCQWSTIAFRACSIAILYFSVTTLVLLTVQPIGLLLVPIGGILLLVVWVVYSLHLLLHDSLIVW